MRGAWFSGAILAAELVVGTIACGPQRDEPTDRPEAARVVARLGEREIRLGDFERWIAERPGATRRVARPGGASAELEALIELMIVEQEAQRLGLDRDPAFLPQRDEIRARAERQERELLRRRLLERLEESVEVSERALHARFDETQGKRITSRIHLRQIVVDDEQTAREVRSRVARGEDFASVAEEVSVIPELRERRGDLGPLLRNDVPEALRTPAFSLTTKGEVSEPFPIGEQWSLLQLVSRELAIPLPFERARPQLERDLQRERVAEAFDQLVEGRRREIGVEIDETLLATLGPPAPRRLRERTPRPSSPRRSVVGGEGSAAPNEGQ